ncbi:hypothetical protein HZY83_07130 [Gemella sp. GH3]|uniref:hypothetical protein n=1 Tax=unclassified Gemella TaxID=2624949 RepID=UPI0015CFF99E|nr:MULTISPECIES: hypothetical protein [unclassified Gemella]MBF0714446.1 hypothetical protein [Gemella sp. GH3.1]NYS51398.1 hypothetical protein [Gemella sp. GH3]
MAKVKEVTINPVEEVNVLVEKAQEALSKFLEEIKEQEKIDEIVQKVGCPMAFKEHDAFAKSGIGFKEYKASLEKLA